MKYSEIIKEVNREKLIHWLKHVDFPLIRTVSFFENMGFSPMFVRSYLRKHKNVLQSGGRIQRKIHGVNEVELLYGLAEAMGIDTSKIARKSSDFIRTKAISQECQRILENADNEISDDIPF